MGTKSSVGKWVGNAAALGVLLAIMWGLEVVDELVLSGRLDQMGIAPRSVDGLKGIFLAPLLHGSFGHLASNTIPLLVLGWFVMFRGRSTFVIATVGVAVIGGLGTWLFGSTDSVHIGASGLVFGYLGFLLGGGIFERSLKAVLLAIAAGLLYGGIVWGVMPGQEGISWEGHLFGFVGGVVLAKLLARGGAEPEEGSLPNTPDED